MHPWTPWPSTINIQHCITLRAGRVAFKCGQCCRRLHRVARVFKVNHELWGLVTCDQSQAWKLTTSLIPSSAQHEEGLHEFLHLLLVTGNKYSTPIGWTWKPFYPPTQGLSFTFWTLNIGIGWSETISTYIHNAIYLHSLPTYVAMDTIWIDDS